jgi:dipeptidyl aminopeptidase/acylaminoacyl peptidase
LSSIGYASAAWSPDGERVALAGGQRLTNPIRVENADGTRLRAVSRPRLATEDDSNPAWSPDGKTIAFSRYVFYGKHTDYSRFGVWMVDVRTRRERHLIHDFANAIAWSPDGETIAADLGGDLEDTIVLLRRDGSVVRRFTVTGYRRFIGGVSWSPDGSRLAVGGGLIVDRAGSTVARYAPPPTDQAVSSGPVWSPDSATIVFARFSVQVQSRTNTWYALPADLYATSVPRGQPMALTHTPHISEGGPAFRPETAVRSAGTSQPCIFEGTDRRDVIRGTAKGDLIYAGAEDDVVDGRRGSDVIDGGAGHDRLHARDRAVDYVFGGPGRDVAWIDPKLDRVAGVETVKR